MRRCRNLVIVTAIAAAAPVFAGCAAVGSNYERPGMAIPAQFRFVPGEQAENLADLPWFEVFADPALQALIREAIANNLDLQVALARVEEARARAGIAASYLYPQVDAGLTYSARGATGSPTDSNGQAVEREIGTRTPETDFVRFGESFGPDRVHHIRRRSPS